MSYLTFVTDVSKTPLSDTERDHETLGRRMLRAVCFFDVSVLSVDRAAL